MDPLELRADIPVCESCTYLNTGASGPAPTAVVDAIGEAQRRHEFGACDPGHYPAAAELQAAARRTIAEHIGCRPDDIALVSATGDGLSRIANAIEWEPGDRVVRTDLEHPAGVLPWRRTQAEVTTVSCPDGRLPLNEYREAVEGARLVCLSSESWLHGTRLPVKEAVDIAHDAGAMIVVDAVQTVGQHPVDVREWGADAVCASGHKWLLGPWGVGFMYIDPDVIEQFRPRHIGYWSVTEPTGEGIEYHPNAQRFEVSTDAVAPYAGLIEAIDIAESIGLETIERRIERLTDRLKSELSGRLISPEHYESGLVTFEVDDAESFVARAADSDVIVRDLPSGAIRVSVHAFNTAEDIDSLVELL